MAMDNENSALSTGDYLDNDASHLSVPDTASTAPQTPLAASSRADSPEISTVPPATPSAVNPEAASSQSPVPKFTVDKRINEDYKLWKKNIPFLYDVCLMTATQFPSYTVDWVPESQTVTDEELGLEYVQQKIVLGTTARNEEDVHLNGIVIMNVRFPAAIPDRFAHLDDKPTEFRSDIGLFSASPSCLFTCGIIAQSYPITNVRIMPQRPQLVCAKLADSTMLVYDWKEELEDGWSYDDPIVEKPGLFELVGHDTKHPASHGLAWNPTVQKEGWLASCAKDGKILVWDVGGLRERAEVTPTVTITGHATSVEDIAWHPLYPTLIASAGADNCFCLFDLRSRDLSRPSHSVVAHTAGVNAVSFARAQYLLATASDDTTIGLWDMRYLGRKLHSLQYHTSDVFSLDWCHEPDQLTVLASGGADRRICLWDVAQVGTTVERSVEVDAPPELVFVHGGHTGRVTDVGWNAVEGRKMVLASVAEDAIVQVWMPAKYQLCTEEIPAAVEPPSEPLSSTSSTAATTVAVAVES
ncbi:histone-binding protein RBBP4-like [Paramacrobiotus metropolitanus]|uniref:histone-binding protein RBBP4-like n=1 Tax=Paramacrobiotus metropolitanus TaxID=2943436 RepID=UPI002445C3F6|nr:histone-binding protein RBBP4-like [Paramacrobiotus metropolitanus]